MELKSTYLNQHVHLYTEDERSISMLRRIFAYKKVDINKYVDHIEVNLGWTNYCQLITKKVPEFLGSMIVLDQDVSSKKQNLEQQKAIANTNVVYMPVDVEKGLFEFLKVHANFNGFNKLLKAQGCEITYDACFSEWTSTDYKTEDYKAWFSHIEKSIPDLNTLYDFWCINNDKLVEGFINAFKDGYNNIVKETGLDYMII